MHHPVISYDYDSLRRSFASLTEYTLLVLRAFYGVYHSASESGAFFSPPHSALSLTKAIRPAPCDCSLLPALALRPSSTLDIEQPPSGHSHLVFTNQVQPNWNQPACACCGSVVDKHTLARLDLPVHSCGPNESWPWHPFVCAAFGRNHIPANSRHTEEQPICIPTVSPITAGSHVPARRDFGSCIVLCASSRARGFAADLVTITWPERSCSLCCQSRVAPM
jgi:hypothetical protein